MIAVHAPQAGRVVPLRDVPDPVFAAAMVGPGIALAPEAHPVVAASPVTGTLLVAKPHAYVVHSPAGAILVHLGIDTVELRGRGFELLAAVGDQLTQAQPVVRWNPGDVAAAGLSPIVVVIALGAAATDVIVTDAARVSAGGLLFTWTPSRSCGPRPAQPGHGAQHPGIQ